MQLMIQQTEEIKFEEWDSQQSNIFLVMVQKFHSK